jgi:multicomponent Na+:H+ antiporter subunit F
VIASDIALALLGVAGLLTIVRLVRGPSFADRVVALDTLLLVIVSAVTADAVRTGSDVYIDVLVIAAILAFVGTSFAARFIEARGEQRVPTRRSRGPADG